MTTIQKYSPHTQSRQPFRILDLPKELQLYIYRKYYENGQITFAVGARGDIVYRGLSLNLERTSHRVRSDARESKKHLSRTMTVMPGLAKATQYERRRTISISSSLWLCLDQKKYSMASNQIWSGARPRLHSRRWNAAVQAMKGRTWSRLL